MIANMLTTTVPALRADRKPIYSGDSKLFMLDEALRRKERARVALTVRHATRTALSNGLVNSFVILLLCVSSASNKHAYRRRRSTCAHRADNNRFHSLHYILYLLCEIRRLWTAMGWRDKMIFGLK